MVKFNILNAIEQRTSVRTYTDVPVSEETTSQIKEFISGLTDPFNNESVKINIINKYSNPDKPVKTGTYGAIKGAQHFLTMMCDDTPQTLLSAGYRMEWLILYLTSLGLGTVWLGGTFKRSDFAPKDMPDHMIMPIVVPYGYGDTKRFAEKLFRKIAKSDTRKPWDVLFFDGNFHTPLTPAAADKMARVLELLRIAPSATNTQPWRVVRESESTYHVFGAFDEEKLSGINRKMRYIDMGIALSHLYLAAEELNLSPKITSNKPEDKLTQDNNYTYIATLHIHIND